MEQFLANKRSAFPLALFSAPHAFSAIAKEGHKLINLRQLGLLPPQMGGATGASTHGDIINRLADGTDPNDLWAEFQATLEAWNASRQAIIDFLTFPVTQQIESVGQGTTVDFELASEFGVPVSAREVLTYFQLGYSFDWYDIATRYTWKFLMDADARAVEAVHQAVLEADNRLVFSKVMNAVFRNTNRVASITGQNYNVFSFYNGTDGTVPPAYKTNTFTSAHTHYLWSGNTAIDSGDLDAVGTEAGGAGTTGVIEHLRHHGYGDNEGSRIVIMVNKQEGDVIRTFRFGVVNNNGATAKFDFVPAAGTSPLIIPNALQGAGLLGGTQVANRLEGLTVIGNYGPALIVQEDWIPAGYVFGFATGGSANLNNPIGLREHANPAARGLQLVQGPIQQYPLQESYYRRGFGTGIRQRGAGVVMRMHASAYAIPTAYV